jgi:drug/metabolite transporter (DMT)-like permease
MPKEWHERPSGKIVIGIAIVAVGAAVVGTSKFFLGI